MANVTQAHFFQEVKTQFYAVLEEELVFGK